MYGHGTGVGRLAEGTQEQNVINASINTLTIMLLYVPMVSLPTGIQGIPVDRWLLVISALVFIGLPLLHGGFWREAAGAPKKPLERAPVEVDEE